MASDDSPLGSSSSPVRKRQRSPSRSPSSGSDDVEDSSRKRRRHDDLFVEVCKDFIHSTCRRAETECKFAHPHSAVTIERDKVMACADSLRSKCFRGRTCRYFHPPPQIQESLLKAIGMGDAKVQMVCKDFIRGRCLRSAKECRFAHHSSIDECTIVCQDYLRGRCERKSCWFAHTLVHAVPQALQYLGASVELPSYPQPGNDHEIIPVCRDFLKNACNRDSCKYAHPDSHAKVLQYLGASVELPSYPQPGNDHKITPVCQDFLKNACNRDSCKYAHPASHTKVCQDYLRGRCERKSCRFSHTLVHTMPQVLQYLGAAVEFPSYPQSGNDHEIIPVCRDFLKNACNRDSCKYAHPDSHATVHLQHHGVSVKLNSSTLLENGAIPNATLLCMPLDHDTVPVCRDFLKNACNRDSCKYFHPIPQPEAFVQQHGTLLKLPSSPPQTENEQESLPVCRDFLKNACRRDSCKFAHPNSQTKVIDNQVEICRDFRRGLCHRTICRFYHPLARNSKI